MQQQILRLRRAPSLREGNRNTARVSAQNDNERRKATAKATAEATATATAKAKANANAGISPLRAARFGRDDNLMGVGMAGGVMVRSKEEADSLR